MSLNHSPELFVDFMVSEDFIFYYEYGQINYKLTPYLSDKLIRKPTQQVYLIHITIIKGSKSHHSSSIVIDVHDLEEQQRLNKRRKQTSY